MRIGKVYFSNYKKAKRGVATYINKRFQSKLIYKDSEGRILITEVIIEGQSILIVNIYAPLEKKDTFFYALNKELCEINKSNIIIAGDFNGVIKPSRDRKSTKKIGVNQGKIPRCAKELMEEQDLTDVWPKLYGEKNGCTFFFNLSSVILKNRYVLDLKRFGYENEKDGDCS